MSLFGIFSGDKSTSETKYETTNTYTDQSAQATEGGVAAGAGASVSIRTADPEVLKIAAAGNAAVSKAALNTNAQVAGVAIDTNARVAQAALNTTFGLAQVASRENQDVLETTRFAMDTQQGTTDALAKLASGALERSQTPDSQTTKTLLYTLGAVFVAIAIAAIFILGGSKKH